MNIDDLIYAPIGTGPRYWIQGDTMHCGACNMSDSYKSFIEWVHGIDPSSTVTCDKAPAGGCPIMEFVEKNRKGGAP